MTVAKLKSVIKKSQDTINKRLRKSSKGSDMRTPLVKSAQARFDRAAKELKARGEMKPTAKPAAKSAAKPAAKPAAKKQTFGQAFAAARKAGKKTFQFTKANGKTETFTTETREEKTARESAAKKKTRLKKTVAKSGADSRKLSTKRKRRAAGKYVGPRQEMVDRLSSKKSYGGGMKKKTVKRQAGGGMSSKPRGVGCAKSGYGKAMK
jgi:hypothetical protein